MTSSVDTTRVGAVVIGRNEGLRLQRSLLSVLGSIRPTVYVDSGSSDGSVECARGLGAEVVELDTSQIYSAARARNAGAARLLELDPAIELVQFVDGDCELVPGWLERGVAELDRDAELAVVCGRQREREPTASIYHRLYEMEWNTPVGPDQHCGGVALIRMAALRSVGGYRASLIAGEEPELCIRLRAHGWRVRRIDAEMSIHDAGAMTFVQWWRRARRAGFAFAEGAALHGSPPARHWVRQSRSIWFWGLALPCLVIGSAAATDGRSLWSLLAYPALWLVILVRHRRHGTATIDAALYATSCVLGKFPEVLGQLTFQFGRWSPSRRSVAGALHANDR